MMGGSRERNRLRRHFVPPGSSGSSSSSRAGILEETGMTEKQAALKEQQMELEKKRWQSTYTRIFKDLNKTGGKSASMLPTVDPIPSYIRECFRSSQAPLVQSYVDQLSHEQREDFIVLLRSFYNVLMQARANFKSEYGVEFRKRAAEHHMAKPLIDPFSSSLGKKPDFAPPKKRETVTYTKPDPKVVEAMRTKKAPPPQPHGGILTIAGGVVPPNSRYREDFHLSREQYESIVPKQNLVTTSTLRLVPSVEIPEEAAPDKIILAMPMDKQERKMLKQRHQHAQPSWHLLHKSVHFNADGGVHERGEVSVYSKDYKGSSGKIKPSKPTIDPFMSSIQIKMSDHTFHTTEYEDAIGRSATMDRSLI
jgi:hypothetical protein